MFAGKFSKTEARSISGQQMGATELFSTLVIIPVTAPKLRRIKGRWLHHEDGCIIRIKGGVRCLEAARQLMKQARGSGPVQNFLQRVNGDIKEQGGQRVP